MRELRPSPIPSRVILSSLEPIGVGTSDCESLSGYINRLAAVHGVTARELADYVRSLPRMEGERYKSDGSLQPYWGTAPGLAGMRLARLTGVPSLAVLAMPWGDHTVALRRYVRKSPVWCSACWHEDIQAGRPTYHRLVWSFCFHERCHRHGTVLEGACPRCASTEQRGPDGWAPPVGCRQCGAPLMRAMNAAAACQDGQASSAAGDAHLAQLFADLVRDMPALGNEPRWPDLEWAYEKAKQRTGLEFQMDVIRQLQTNAVHLSRARWPERKRQAISLGAVVKFAAAAGVPILDVLKAGKCRIRFTGEPELY